MNLVWVGKNRVFNVDKIVEIFAFENCPVYHEITGDVVGQEDRVRVFHCVNSDEDPGILLDPEESKNLISYLKEHAWKPGEFHKS